MPLSPGSRVGRYEVTGTLGAGGMGEVYRARDVRLNRDVAIKSLPEGLAHDAERVARFEREAQLLASLNHPHIASVYGVEEIGTVQFIVLELVEGGTLADRLARGPVAPREALQIARGIADALSAAHEKGIVHRDLKPANVALSATGEPKVLDFGLAKAALPDADSVTVAAATRTGMVMGTAPYMSPEQARGESVDRRSDIWSFGCVFFEMLAGRRPFAGPTSSDVVAAILERAPDFDALPQATPARVRALLQRCLEKDRRRRLHDMADARIEIEDALGETASGAIEAARVSGAPRARLERRELAAWGAAIAALVLLGWTLVNRGPASAPPDTRVSRTSITLPGELQVAPLSPAGRFAISPDGTRLVYAGPTPGGPPMLWIRPLDSLAAQPLPGTEGGAFPFWSPDSRWVGFVSRAAQASTVGQTATLKKVEVASGQLVTLANQAFSATGAWTRDNVILFTPTGASAIFRVSALSPGAPAPVTTLDAQSGDVQHSYPWVLPDGRHFLYTVVGSRGAATHARAVYIGSLEGAPSRLLTEGGSNAKYADGHVLFTRGATLFAQRFDLATMTLQGEAMPISERVQVSDSAEGGSLGAFSVSNTGWLVYQVGLVMRSQLEWIGRDGTRIERVGEPDDYVDVSLSPDASRAVMSVMNAELGTRDLYIQNLARGTRERLTGEPSDEYAPVWSAQGDRVIYSSMRQGVPELFERASGSSAERKVETGTSPLGKFAASWSPDGRALLYVAGGRILARSDIYVVDPNGGPASPWLDSASVETHPRFSRDGRFVAYSSNESEKMQVYVRPFPGPGTATRVSINGGGWPRWGADGEILFLALDGAMMAAAMTVKGSTITAGEPRVLFKVRSRPQGRLDSFPYDVTADGQRFLLNTFVEHAGTAGLTLLTNWTAAVR